MVHVMFPSKIGFESINFEFVTEREYSSTSVAKSVIYEEKKSMVEKKSMIDSSYQKVIFRIC